MPACNDASYCSAAGTSAANRRVLKHQQRKLSSQMKDLVKTKATGSGYSALPRQQKRQAEHHRDEVTREQSLQKDLRRAETMARRIGQVVDKIRKDLNKIKNFVGDYNFTNTVGMDSNGTGLCESDLSAAIDTRQAWKMELKNMVTMLWHYADAQYLGDYAIAHTVDSASQNACTSVCCPKVYRSYFDYFTPRGDCLAMPSSAGGHSGDSTLVAPSGDSGSASTNPAAENKDSPSGLGHSRVTNSDMKLRRLAKLLCGDNDTWSEYIIDVLLVALGSTGFAAAFVQDDVNVDGNPPANTNRVTHLSTTLQTQLLLTEEHALAILDALISDTSLNPAVVIVDVTFVPVASHAHIHSIDNIEDESDIGCIIHLLNQHMEDARNAQLQNDREQQRIQYVRETSECNQSFHQDAFDDLTHVDFSEVEAKYRTGKKLCSDLDVLYKDNCVTKQTFFNGVSKSGCCW